VRGWQRRGAGAARRRLGPLSPPARRGDLSRQCRQPEPECGRPARGPLQAGGPRHAGESRRGGRPGPRHRDITRRAGRGVRDAGTNSGRLKSLAG
jgi:hypothetical protein